MHSEFEYICLKLCDVIFKKDLCHLTNLLLKPGIKYVLEALKSMHFDPAIPLLSFYVKEQMRQICRGIYINISKTEKGKHKCLIKRAFINYSK